MRLVCPGSLELHGFVLDLQNWVFLWCKIHSMLWHRKKFNNKLWFIFLGGLWWVVPDFIHAEFTRTKPPNGVFVLANLAHCKEEKIGKTGKRAKKALETLNPPPPTFALNHNFRFLSWIINVEKFPPKTFLINFFSFNYHVWIFFRSHIKIRFFIFNFLF